ncbi:Verru_Chthon cassette protein C [Verrucomicrobium sp. BvORR106]|uniref:Verru_Chthon cassette protein C n=1 Tax=Verrucomicrobium sp. BvORR106 TaxID=1403819 RepID=UPI0022410358|nr:Verru_Chthon cassette protein C [Verrucomicrobium sp. BvORR106]
MRPTFNWLADGRRRKCLGSASSGFTLIELLVSITILAILMTIVAGVIGETQKAWKYASGRATQFREARFAFDLITRSLSQSTLNAYWDYDQGGVTATNQIPTRYIRQSELQFVCGRAATLVKGAGSGTGDASRLPYHAVFFQAPLGVAELPEHTQFSNMLCARGYFVQFGNDAAIRPPFVTKDKFRYRLMEYSPSAERNMIYYNRRSGASTLDWFSDAGTELNKSAEGGAVSTGNSTTRGLTRPVAENILALIVAPKVSRAPSATVNNPYWIASDYTYNSAVAAPSTATSLSPQGTQHLLPPLVDVIMVALDESSASQLDYNHDSAPIDLAGTAPFTTASESAIAADLKSLEVRLVNEKVNFRIFRTTVELRGSRWSL